MAASEQEEGPVTVCIAAIADHHEAIVSCVDTRISTAITSFDPFVGSKMAGMRGWTVLSSGSLSDIESLLDAFYAELKSASDNNPPAIQRCLESALRSELPKYSAARYLTPYGLDMPTFLHARPTGFTDERWNEISRLMLEYSDTYDVEIVVSGWGGDQEVSKFAGASIFSASRNGVNWHTAEGFFACGSGAAAAHSVLSFFNQQSHMALAETIYHVAAAKFMSERTSGVGPKTLIRVATRAGPEHPWKGYFIQPEEIDQIYELWRKHTASRIPAEAEDKIVNILAKRGSLHVSQNHMVRRVQNSIEQTKELDAQESEPKP
jgi:hypothetical protein